VQNLICHPKRGMSVNESDFKENEPEGEEINKIIIIIIIIKSGDI
jgi:hypothetical protein